MADVKISALPAASAADGTELVPVVQAGTTSKMTVDQFKTYITTGLPSGGLPTKAGISVIGDFSGSPLTATVVFTDDFVGTYTVSIVGKDPRLWSYANETASGFDIVSNSDTALTGDVSWQAISVGEST